MYKEILNSLIQPISVADVNHVLIYMNDAAHEHFKNYGGRSLLGKSVFDCHKDASKKRILEIFEKMQNGLNEESIRDDDVRKICMRAVRDEQGRLIGYYERYKNKE